MSYALVLQAAVFAAAKHTGQHRKDASRSPYINHPLEVSAVLAVEAGIEDERVLAAALLHDTVEDTDTTLHELEAAFGPEIAGFVAEVTDDKKLPKAQRKDLQVSHAPHLSPQAKLIKLADKICNVRDITYRPPANWPPARRIEYVDWTERVIAGCRGTNAQMERIYDETLAAARRTLQGLDGCT
jgi:guanosine-3',5'-bis(diphosphate) 3'-pyrophosphohydrolase